MKALHLVPILSVALLAGCTERRELPVAVSSFHLEVSGPTGSPGDPLLFPEAPLPIEVTVTALSNRGGKLETFDGEVTLYTTPGKAQTIEGSTKVELMLTGGSGTRSMALVNVYGRTHVCARDDRRGLDSTYTAGCSQTVYFQMPTSRQVQVTEDATTSPLIGSFLEVRRGDLIITGIQPEGFYVSDLDEPPHPTLPGNFSGLFIFSFSYPENLQLGDRLESVLGTVQEFTGATQLVFPSWVRRQVPTAVEDVPSPVEITTEMCGRAAAGSNALLCGYDNTDLNLESLEAGVVMVRNVRSPSRWVDCDINQDGLTVNYEPSCAQGDPRILCQEIACKNDCNLDPTCSELSSFNVYGQWTVAMNSGAGPKINVLTREGFPDFDPVKPENFGTLMDVAGNLRHSLPARPRWIIVSRHDADVTLRR